MKRLLLIAAIFLIPSVAYATTSCPLGANYGPNQNQTFAALGVTICYYVSVSTGADSNSGGTELVPWAHLPGMPTCTGSCSSFSPVSTIGYGLILKGCDDWGNSSFPINWNWSGTSTHPIYIDRDPTWYNTTNCPSGWNRAKFDAGSAIINPPECTNNNTFFQFNATSYVTVSWVELTNYFWTSNQAGGSCFGHEAWVSASNSAANITWAFGYIHAWTVKNGADDIDHGFLGCSQTCAVTYLVADNSDGTIHTGIGMQWPTQYSIFKDVANALKPNNSGEYAYNDISHTAATGSPIISTSVHPNCIETIATLRGNGNVYIHDNRIHDQDNGTSGGAGGCEGLQVGNPGETDYVWNNLWYNNTVSGANGPDLPQNNNNAVAMYYFNNTNVDQRNYCIASDSPGNFWSQAFVAVNNHCITSGTPSGTTQSGNLMNYTVSGATTITFSNNLVESLTTANGQGYTNAQTYVYSPTSGSSPTVGAGINLTSTYWPAGFTTNDTTYACSESTVSGVVQSVCPARPANSRPSSGAWDEGAYEFAGGQAASPTCVPGSGTYAGGQGVICTNPNTGTTIQCYTTNGSTPQTNGSGTFCIVGTSLASGGTVVISSSKTLKLVAGTSTLTDSAVASYAYVITGSGGGGGGTGFNTGTVNTGTLN